MPATCVPVREDVAYHSSRTDAVMILSVQRFKRKHLRVTSKDAGAAVQDGGGRTRAVPGPQRVTAPFAVTRSRDMDAQRVVGDRFVDAGYGPRQYLSACKTAAIRLTPDPAYQTKLYST